MLNFFRTYQRFFFVVITAVVVISFCFFGTMGSYSNVQDVPDRVVVEGIDGSKIMQRDLSALCRMIGNSPFDRSGMQRGGSPNLLNDGVIEKDLMASSAAMLLARHYFEELRPDLEKRLARIKTYRPYTHPQHPQISAEAIWRQFHPTLPQHLMLLRTKSDQLTVETLGAMFQLYLDQVMLPPDFLKHVLAQQINQQGLSPDPMLAHADLSLFGFHSLEDWFGPRFIELTGQFMINVARFADSRGYHISNEAVRTDLYQNIVNGFREMSRQEKIQPQDVDAYYQRKMHEWGMDERQMLDSWRHVMLFRRLFQDVGNSVLLDPLVFEQFHRYTKEALEVDLYELPSHLCFRDLMDLFKFQVYLEGISSDHVLQKNLLAHLQPHASFEEIEKRAPELILQQIEVEYAQVHKDQLVREVSLKETWDWEVQDASWVLLTEQFRELSFSKVQSVAERHRALDQLDSAVRLKVDLFAQERMLEQQPHRITAALDKAAVKTHAFGLRKAGSLGPFHQISNPQQLATLLYTAPLRGQPSSPEQEAIQQRLNLYSDDQQTFYRIAVLSRNDEKTLLSFAQAQRDGTLDRMLDKRLEKAYPDVRRKSSAQFQKADGTWKPYGEVKQNVGRIVFAELLKAIEESNRPIADLFTSGGEELPSSFYVQNRFYSFLNHVKSQIAASGDDLQWIKTDDELTVDNQWKLVKSCQTIERNSDFRFAKEQMFNVPIGSWSPVDTGKSGSLAFYKALNAKVSSAPAIEETTQGHQHLSLDAQRNLCLDLIQQMEAKKAIKLTAFSEEEL